MTWTGSTGDRAPWTHAGSSMSCLVSDDVLPVGASVVAILGATDQNIGVCFRMTPGGQSRLVVRFTRSAANTCQADLYQVTYGVQGSSLDDGTTYVGDNSNFSVEVRVVAGRVTAYVNGDSTALIDYDLSGLTDPFEFYARYGVDSDVDGAKVLGLKRCSLVASVADRADLLVAIGGGELWASEDGVTLRRVASGVTRPEGQVSAAELNQHAYIVDGTNAKDFDAAAMTVADYAPTNAGIIGAEETAPSSGVYKPGTTTASVVVAHLGRLGFAGMKGDPQNIVLSASDDPADLDNGSDLEGAAFVLNTGQGTVGQPVRALVSATNTTLAIGCSQSWHALRGDPAIGGVQRDRITGDVGVSGLSAGWLVADGLVVAHSAAGLVAIPTEGGMRYLSRDVLTEGIQIDTGEVSAFDDYIVSVIRDPSRHGLHVFLTPKATGGGRALHFWYDERIDKWQGGGGFFPDDLPENAGPTAVGLVNGQVVMGSRDGYLFVFDDDETTDYDDSAFTPFASLSVLVAEGLGRDVICHGGYALLDETLDGLTIAMYGGRTAREALIGDDRWLIWSQTATRTYTKLSRRARAPFMALELRSTGEDATWRLEVVELDLESGKASRGGRSVPTVPTVCVPSVAAEGDDGFDEGDGNEDEDMEIEFWPGLYTGTYLDGGTGGTGAGIEIFNPPPGGDGGGGGGGGYGAVPGPQGNIGDGGVVVPR